MVKPKIFELTGILDKRLHIMQVNGNIDKNRKISVMGILNITGDSYFAPSRCLDGNGDMVLSEVIERVGKMFEEGADIVDIGACSTRPGAALADEAEEWRRLSPLMDVLRREFPDRMFSIDTFRAGIVENCFDRIGPFIINDISAGEDDPAMLDTAGRLGLTYIAMHKRGVPETMQSLCEYANVTEEIVAYFRHFERKAAASGITDWILDPGFGFAKTVGQNYQLLRDLEEFSVFAKKILAGVSRKSMIYKKFGITPEESLPQTQVLHFAALQNGADILRVHDVAEAVRTVAMYRILS